MSRPARRPAIALALAGAVLAAGCGSAAPRRAGTATRPAPPAPSLNSSLVTPAGTWAVAVMGGSAAQHNNFWQLFMRPARTTRWKLVTPPGTADNGGLVLAGSGQSLITGFRPSQDLTYTPLAVTASDGHGWSSAGPLDAALADVPDALASAPGSRNLLALLADGTATLAAPGYASWTTLASRLALAATPPGRRCGLQNLTAAAYGPSGMPMLAGACAHPGTAGIFAYTGATWHPAGPPLPTALARAEHHRAHADYDCRTHHGTAGRQRRISHQPARRLDRRQWQPLGAVALVPAERREADLSIARAPRHHRDNPEREPRTGNRRPRSQLAAAASDCHQARPPSPQDRQAASTQWPSTAPR